ncbi:hypothetical protein BIU87_25895 [Streptomyces sp. ZS0098]|uniref:hypothetical protein n=1 Tax=Streptomyces sp. ZS0098 TaxID=1904044 RepID=UPI000EFB0CD6|nr:hypothetical protein [Streptomyces sp. ZS0098]RMI90356.1 hypothetical protein BIU87_25895 [Streptomyces sp. ZS0098]
MRQPSDSGAVTGEPEGPDPVFVDASGRRARLLRRAGYGAAGLAAGYLSVLALSLMGATPFAPEALLPPLPGESAPTAPLRQDAEGDARPPEEAGAGVGPGTPLIPLIAGEEPAGSLLLPPGADPGSVAGVPVQPPDAGGAEVTDGPTPPEEPGDDAEEPGAPEEPQEPGAGEPSAPGDGGDSEAPPPGTDEPSGPGTGDPPEPPGTPQFTPEAPSGNPGSLPDDPPGAGTP